MRFHALWATGFCAALALFATLPPTGEPAGEDTKRESAFADPRALEARFEEALNAAEEICGAPFPKRPTSLAGK